MVWHEDEPQTVTTTVVEDQSEWVWVEDDPVVTTTTVWEEPTYEMVWHEDPQTTTTTVETTTTETSSSDHGHGTYESSNLPQGYSIEYYEGPTQTST